VKCARAWDDLVRSAKGNDPSQMTQPVKDPRIYFAVERTLLAWIRTGLALMGFGFVVARFGLFLRELGSVAAHIPVRSSGFSLWTGTALVLGMRGCERNIHTAVSSHPARLE
jgi:uncharacterized membrane protein YidH (DUF202 family)